jgi:hypothetical protein
MGRVSEDFTPGYPIDLRSPARRARLAAGPVGDFEGMAARVVARLTGERVAVQDDGSEPSMPDIRIDQQGRPPAFVEAVVDIETRYASMEAAIRKVSVIPADKVWWARLAGRADIRTLKRKLPGILNDLQSAPGPGARQQLARLGIRVTGPGEPIPGQPGGIRLIPEGVSGFVGPIWESFLGWINEFLASARTEDVRRKLAATGAAERHAFIGASFTTPGDAFFALSYEGRPGLPNAEPCLPPEITHLWAWSAMASARCLAWFPGRGWLDVADHWATA